MLRGPWAGSMQNMHPQLGAAVEEHSLFFQERWQRLLRSLYPIGGTLYDGDRAPQTAREVRDYHRTIKGADSRGRRYSALDPEVFFWAHATFILTPVLMCEHFGTPLTRPQKEQLYAEGVQWYRLYGMSMRPVPPDWDSFCAYVERMSRDVLEDNKATRDVLDLSTLPKPPALDRLPDAVWRRIRGPITRMQLWMTIGMYSPAVRELLGYSWSGRDQLAFRAAGRVIALSWRLVPPRRRMHPRARAGFDRAAGRCAADAPLPQTPSRFLPPESERGSPTHYCPV